MLFFVVFISPCLQLYNGYRLLFKANVTLKLAIHGLDASRQLVPKMEQLLPCPQQQGPMLKASCVVMTFRHHKLQGVTPCVVIQKLHCSSRNSATPAVSVLLRPDRSPSSGLVRRSILWPFLTSFLCSLCLHKDV